MAKGGPLYAGFTHFEFAPDATGYYMGRSTWVLGVTMKGDTRPDQEMVAFLHCNGYIEFSYAD